MAAAADWPGKPVVSSELGGGEPKPIWAPEAGSLVETGMVPRSVPGKFAVRNPLLRSLPVTSLSFPDTRRGTTRGALRGTMEKIKGHQGTIKGHQGENKGHHHPGGLPVTRGK